MVTIPIDTHIPYVVPIHWQWCILPMHTIYV